MERLICDQFRRRKVRKSNIAATDRNGLRRLVDAVELRLDSSEPDALDVKAVIPGESYLIISAAFKGFRIIRRSEQADELLLLPRNAEEYDPISIKQSSIEKLFIVRGIIIKKIL